MICVITADEAASTTITVDGKLAGDWVEPVAYYAEHHRPEVIACESR